MEANRDMVHRVPAMILGSHCGAMMNTVPEEGGAVIIILEAVLKGWRTKRYDKIRASCYI